VKATFVNTFWPSNYGAFVTAAECIRARLGVWPPASPFRLCFTAPDTPRVGDVLIAVQNGSSASRAKAFDAGLNVIEAGEREVMLHIGAARYPLELGAPLGVAWLPALAAFLDCGFALPDALVLALAWRAGEERLAIDPWPDDPARFPRVSGLPKAPVSSFAPCPRQLELYPIVPTAEWVERVLACGVSTVQLRMKDVQPTVLKQEVARAVAAGRSYPGAHVFINDHWGPALEAGAYGVHLGQEDLHTADLAALAAAGMRLGLSSHGYYEMLIALYFRPSYLALGPVFSTSTKAVAAAPQGLDRIARYVRFAGATPLVAIGGINRTNMAAVRAAGVGSVAVASAVTDAVDFRTNIMAMQQTFH